MTREQLEANWRWDPERGDIPFVRPRLTPKNIRDQQELARPGTLIHWAGKPCHRGQNMVDTTPVIGADPPQAVNRQASLIENVNCLQCRKTYFN